MKLDFLRNNLGLKLASLVLALVLWLYVKSLEVPMSSFTSQIPLQILGEPSDVRVLAVPNDISVTLNLPTSEVPSVDRARIMREARAYIDLREAREGSFEYVVRFVPPPSARKYSWDWERRVTVTAERVARRTMEVRLVPTGNPPQGLEFANAALEPMTVTIESGASALNRVATVRVLLPLEDVVSGQALELPVEVLDAMNRPLSRTLVRSVPAKVRVTPALAPSQPRRNLVVSPIWTGQPALGYRVVEARLEPAGITVVGERSRLQGLSVIETEPIDLNGLAQNAIREVRLRVPPGVQVQGRPFVRVRIRVARSTIEGGPAGSPAP